MAELKITLTDTELTALKTVAYDPLELVQNFAQNRARISINNICSQLMIHCNENDIAMEVGRDKQVKQALDLGLVEEVSKMSDIVPVKLSEE